MFAFKKIDVQHSVFITVVLTLIVFSLFTQSRFYFFFPCLGLVKCEFFYCHQTVSEHGNHLYLHLLSPAASHVC